MILVLDNYDSFVHNLARYVTELGGEPLVRRNDAVTVEDVRAMEPSHLVISPGPCTPAEAGVAPELVRALMGTMPILGVCLGHQCIAAALGGRIVRGRRPMHGRASAIEHDGTGILAGLPSPLRAGRYHSLVVEEESLPAALRVTARSEEGEIMAIEHREHPVFGVQFHPESVLTDHGHEMLRNFMQVSSEK
jgi:anthranilate synthase/aminodeoxychorismate synthase-like glutamine amidotransferase